MKLPLMVCFGGLSVAIAETRPSRAKGLPHTECRSSVFANLLHTSVIVLPTQPGSIGSDVWRRNHGHSSESQRIMNHTRRCERLPIKLSKASVDPCPISSVSIPAPVRIEFFLSGGKRQCRRARESAPAAFGLQLARIANFCRREKGEFKVVFDDRNSSLEFL